MDARAPALPDGGTAATIMTPLGIIGDNVRPLSKYGRFFLYFGFEMAMIKTLKTPLKKQRFLLLLILCQ